MKVLLLGSTGNVGSRILSALLAHSHTPVLYVRNISKLPQEIVDTIGSANLITGDATDSQAITNAIQHHNCEAVISAAGVGNMFSHNETFPKIFKAIVDAAASAARQRGHPIRCWMLSGFGLLDVPNTRNTRMEKYLPLFPDHKGNFAHIQTISTQELAWSLLCANQMTASKELNATEYAKANSSKIAAMADTPPAWSDTAKKLPLVGGFLNVIANVTSYGTTLEDAAEVIVRDLDNGLESEFVGKRVGIKVLA